MSEFKYTGTWGVDGVANRHDIPHNNFKELKKYLRGVCMKNIVNGGRGWVQIWHTKFGPSYEPSNDLYYAELKS